MTLREFSRKISLSIPNVKENLGLHFDGSLRLRRRTSNANIFTSTEPDSYYVNFVKRYSYSVKRLFLSRLHTSSHFFIYNNIKKVNKPRPLSVAIHVSAINPVFFKIKNLTETSCCAYLSFRVPNFRVLRNSGLFSLNKWQYRNNELNDKSDKFKLSLATITRLPLIQLPLIQLRQKCPMFCVT